MALQQRKLTPAQAAQRHGAAQIFLPPETSRSASAASRNWTRPLAPFRDFEPVLREFLPAPSSFSKL